MFFWTQPSRKNTTQHHPLHPKPPPLASTREPQWQRPAKATPIAHNIATSELIVSVVLDSLSNLSNPARGGGKQGGVGDGVRGGRERGARRNRGKHEERLYVAADKIACKN